MAEVQADPILEALESVSARKERLHKAFTELNSCESVGKWNISWKELHEHFADIEKVVKRQVDELREKEQAFEAKAKKLHQDHDQKEEAVFQREQASLGRVQEQKDLAIAAIFEEKRKWSEEKQILKANGVNVISDAKSAPGEDNTKTIIVNAKEKAVAAANGSSDQAMDVDSSQVITADADGANEAAQDAITNKNVSHQTVKVRPQLKSLCEDMDGDGLTKYVTEHRKDIGALRSEMPSALQFAIDPARLVLRALEGYQLPEHGSSQTNDKDAGASAIRRACILLLESLAVVLADPLLGVDHIVVPSNIKESAKEMADKWKSTMDFQADATLGNSLDAQAFLQLLATFGIASEYDADDLCNLVLTIARRKQTPALCKSLGLASKIPDLVDKLSKEGKEIEALAFAHTFGIMDEFEPVPLLKAYLKEARKTAQSIVKNGNNSPAAQNDSAMKELSALKAVLRCIEEYKLEAQFSSAPLQRRVAQLEKAKSDRKRAAVAVKAQAKRPRASGAAGGHVISPSDRGLLRASERRQYPSAGLSSYGLSPQSTYDSRHSASYAATYAGVRSPASSYLYSTDVLAPQVYGASAYSNPSASYSSYQFGGMA
ncbi:hypothetical protein O6H91_05G049000 [Diphasiastrum complanatum]|uniref:Uncharacterized protein n=1 Tax=Diphasiastrum complanatum TaxID=34168 RepID=A0ACC2DMZ2_DIPCM|nr:hypothetical protein O6H91_05G049000 [Diphasiastrum complanatum]